MTDELWKDIKGYPQYMVSDHGRVKNCMRNKVLCPGDGDGYLKVGLYKGGKRKFFLVQRLVAVAFVPNPGNLPEVNHIDEDRHNNFAWNLEWLTRQENGEYSLAKGYQLVDPSGVVVTVFNMRKFCIDNHLNRCRMHKVIKGESSHHHGWTKQ